MHFSSLCERCNIKLIDFATVEVCDPRTHSNSTTVMCYLESENAWCDSGDALCFTKDAAREEAARRFLELLEKHGFDEKKVDNLETRSMSPVCTASRTDSDKKVRSTLAHTDDSLPSRAKSTSPRQTRSRSATAGSRQRSWSVFGSIKSMFRNKKSVPKK